MMCAACMDPNVICTEHGVVERAEPVHKMEVLIDGEWVEVGGIQPAGEVTGWRQELSPMTFMGVPFTQVAKDVYEITEEAVMRAPFALLVGWEQELIRMADELGLVVWYERDIMRRVWRFKFETEKGLPHGHA
ncbi:hypothetical protein PBI_JOHANN_40 [Microbacterium phage Johann]|uniref:Uncharacterized protein n=2 Tax=Goodmanvirus goodman TaxID=2734238 RepID=A0A3G3LZZ5_9CAUD|nr:hypothetical protein HOU56_gp40 [Microbacterium phage Goodman]AYQ99496.1 hypothetical protein PBI_GOODMAN_40 [Microbacterium phage Goodman]AYQ99664.1 hypothetical protein PBI_JOHANN_40 [Microbacterium phage Johann]